MPEDIKTILRKVNKDGRWSQKLNLIKKGMDTYEDQRLNALAAPIGQIVEDYLNPILPTYWEVFHTHNISRRETGALPCRENDRNHLPYYDVGIFLVGFSSLPIALSIAEIQPREQIYFLYSKDTENTLYEIFNRTETMLCGSNPELVQLVENTVLAMTSSALEIDNPSDPVSTFKQIKGIVDRVGSDKTIALDLTGGKKTMIGGGFTAGAILTFADSIRSSACDMFYIDSLEYNVDRGAPVPGTEFLSLLENPYDVYNVQSVREAKKLFEQHNYEEAANLWEGVKDKLESRATWYGLETERAEAVNSYKRTTCYHLWDAFYYDKAKNSKNRHENSWGYNEKHARNPIDTLEILNRVSNRQTLFENRARVIHYAVDRYQNAIRRKESGKLDDAIVRFTQVIEILCVYRIYQQWPIVANRSGERQERCPDPNNDIWHIKPLIQFLFGQLTREEDKAPTPPEGFNGNPPYNVYQNGRDFYWFNNPPLCINDYSPFSVDKITDLIEYRNEFIHVTSAMRRSQTEENTRKLQKLALRFLANFSKDYRGKQCLSFKNLLKLHRFQKE